MTKKFLVIAFAAALLSGSTSASADVIGASALLGIVEPGTPANEPNERDMVNGLLNGWTSVAGYNDGAASGTVMGDNPDDAQDEVYTLKYATSGSLVPAAPAPNAAAPWARTVTNNTTINLGNFGYQWLVAKWGQDSAVYYIGNLASNTNHTLTLGGTGWENQTGRGLSHYTFFNQGPPRQRDNVPDGGTTSILLGAALAGIAAVRRRMSR